MMRTPCTLAVPSWQGTSGVRDGAWCHPGVTWGGEARGAGNPKKSWITGKNVREGGRRQTGSLSLSLPVANKWIHEHGQEFRRPCGANQQD